MWAKYISYGRASGTRSQHTPHPLYLNVLESRVHWCQGYDALEDPV